jgi:hypothetical protein
MTNLPKFVSDLITTVSDNFKKILSAIGIFYCLGFIINRGYLLGYGINEVEFLQSKYISNGVYFSINVIFVLLPFIIKIINHLSSKEQNTRSIGVIDYIILIIDFMIFCISCFVWIYIVVLTQHQYIFLFKLFLFFLIIVSVTEFLYNKNVIQRLKLSLPNFNEEIRKTIKLIIQLIFSICVSHVFLYLSLASNINVNWSILLNPLKPETIQYINGYYSFLLEIVGWYIALLIIGISLFFLVVKGKEIEATQILFVNTKYWLIVIVTIFSLFTIQKYAREIYPKIATNLGGGNPTIVELVLKNDSLIDSPYFDNRFKLLNKEYKSDSDDSESPKNLLLLHPVKLIAENSSYYYIAPLTKEENRNEIPGNCINDFCEQFNQDQNYKILQISKDDVSSIIYIEDND